MEVAVESLSNLERRVKVVVPAEQVDQEVQNRLKKLAQTSKMKRFRPGKVPFAVVKRQYEDSVRHEVVSDLMRSSFHEALSQQQLTPAGMPHIKPVHMEPGIPLEYEATFEIYPQIEL